MKPFATKLDDRGCRLGGFGSCVTINPSGLADEIFGEEIPGPWLCCYMLRRFGWPNAGSDDYKNLMSWTLTTPIDGLYLLVTPYLGGSNLHFGIRCTDKVMRQLMSDPGRDAYVSRYQKAIVQWWNTKGRKLYQAGWGKAEGDPDTLVHAGTAPKDGKVFGLWKLADGRQIDQRGNVLGKKNREMWIWWLDEFIRKQHPEVKLPKMTKRERARRESVFHRQVKAAIKATLLDLLRQTNVRDVDFNIFGLDGTPVELKRLGIHRQSAGYWEGVGNTPEYWYSPDARKERAAAKRKAKASP